MMNNVNLSPSTAGGALPLVLCFLFIEMYFLCIFCLHGHCGNVNAMKGGSFWRSEGVSGTELTDGSLSLVVITAPCSLHHTLGDPGRNR